MTAHQNIKIFLKKNQKARIIIAIAGSASNSLALWLGILILCAWIDVWLPMPYAIRMFIKYAVTASIFLTWGVKSYLIIRYYSIQRIACVLQKEFQCSDALINAYQLGLSSVSTDISADLTSAYINTISTALPAVSLRHTLKHTAIINPFKRLCIIGMLAGVLSVVPPAPFSSFIQRLFGSHAHEEIFRYLDIEPRDASIPEGEPLNILVRQKILLPAPFMVYIRSKSTEWEQVRLEPVSDTQWIYRFEHVTTRFEYYVRMKDMKTKSFIITPRIVPRIRSRQYHYRYPAYTKQSDRDVIDESEIYTLPGTNVTITAQTNIPVLKGIMHFADGRIHPAQCSGTSLQTSFIVDTETAYWFELMSADGFSCEDPYHVPIRLMRDQEPIVEIRAPLDNLITAPDRQVPITYATNDDFGITSIGLVYKKEKSDKEKKIVLKRFENPPGEYIGDYDWHLAPLMLAAGERIIYYLEAEDNDELSGHKSGRSNVQYVEMISFEKEHERISAELENFRDRLLDILGDQMLAKESLQRVIGNTDEKFKETNAQLVQETAAMQASINRRLSETTTQLGKTLASMGKDPLSERSVYMEHQAMHQSLEYISNTMAPSISNKINAAQIPQARDAQQSLIAELEKMQLLSEDVLKRKNMRDIVNTAESLTNKAQGMYEKLEQISSQPSPEELQMFKDVLNELSSLMREMERHIRDMPQELPEDFVNQEAIRTLSMPDMQRASQDIMGALQAGDMGRAIQMAKALLEKTRNLLHTIQTACRNAMPSGNSSSSEYAAGEQSFRELEQIIIEQENLLTSSERFEQIRQQRLSQYQEELLKKMALIQKKALEKTKYINDNIQKNEPPPLYLGSRSEWCGIQAVKKMNDVISEFTQGRIIKSRQWVEEIITHLTEINNLIQSVIDEMTYKKKLNSENRELVITAKTWYEQTHKDVAHVIDMEKDILNQITSQSEPKDIFKTSEEKTLNELGGSQQKLGGRTQQMVKKIEEFSRKTAMIGFDTIEKFHAAVNAMDSASQSLEKFKTLQAVESQRTALQNLLEGKNAMSESLQALQKMLAGAGQPMAGFYSFPGTGSTMPGGVAGFQEGSVHIPSADEYAPPAEFREEILKSMQEKYPPVYESIIKEYYRQLTQ